MALVRNTIVNTFLESDGDILVMVDDDVVPPLDILDHLLPIPDGYGVVAIPYPALQNTNFAFSVFDETPEGFRPKSWPYQDGWNQADAVGTGCVAIPRVALESLGKSPFRLEDDPRMKVIGEDFIFSSDLRKAGYKIGFWWDANIADHISTSSMIHFLEATTRHG